MSQWGRAATARTGPPLECRGLGRSYGDIPALVDLDLRLEHGQVLALVGLNGAGKTTFMRLALGMVRPDRGTVRVLGEDVTDASGACWAEVGHLVETPFAYPELTVRENLWAAARLHGVRRDRARAAVAAVVDRLALEPWADRRCGTLSLGSRQRVGLASALVHRPRLLVLDEPTNALDPAGVVLLRDLVQELAADGAAILASSHHLDEVARVADTVTALHRGSLVGELDPHGVDLERSFFAMLYAADQRAGLAPAGAPTDRAEPTRERSAG